MGEPAPSLDANFFDVGGDSLGAIELGTLLVDAFGDIFPSEPVYLRASVEGLADLVRNSQRHVDTGTLFQFRRGGSGQPVVLFPGAHGNLAGFSRIGGYPFDRPVFGMQSLGFGTDEPLPLTHISDIADAHVDVITAHLRHRAVHLVGHCFGAIVAYEVSRRLGRGGFDVLSVQLIDPTRSADLLEFDEAMNNRLVELAERYGVVDRGVGSFSAETLFHELRKAGAPVLESDQEAFLRRQSVIVSNVVAAGRYTPQPQDAPLAVYDGNDLSDVAERRFDWLGLTRGSHASVLEVGSHELLSNNELMRLLETYMQLAEGELYEGASAHE